VYKTAVLKPTKPAAATTKTIKDITFLDDDKIKTNIENDYYVALQPRTRVTTWGILCNALQAYPFNIINS
jgi:hypothetical protein